MAITTALLAGFTAMAPVVAGGGAAGGGLGALGALGAAGAVGGAALGAGAIGASAIGNAVSGAQAGMPGDQWGRIFGDTGVTPGQWKTAGTPGTPGGPAGPPAPAQPSGFDRAMDIAKLLGGNRGGGGDDMAKKKAGPTSTVGEAAPIIGNRRGRTKGVPKFFPGPDFADQFQRGRDQNIAGAASILSALAAPAYTTTDPSGNIIEGPSNAQVFTDTIGGLLTKIRGMGK